MPLMEIYNYVHYIIGFLRTQQEIYTPNKFRRLPPKKRKNIPNKKGGQKPNVI